MNNSYFRKGALNSPILCYQGNVNDLFAAATPMPLTMELAMHSLLKNNDYERVVYYTNKNGAYFYDKVSYDLWNGRQEEQDLSSLFEGLDIVSIPSDTDNTNTHSGRYTIEVSSIEMLRRTEQFVKNDSIRTAVVFPDGYETLDEFYRYDNGASLNRMISNILKADISPDKQFNTAIFIFNRTENEYSHERSYIKEVIRRLQNNSSAIHTVPRPSCDEIRSLLNYLRIYGNGTKTLKIDFDQVITISKMLEKKIAQNCSPINDGKAPPSDYEIIDSKNLHQLRDFLLTRFVNEDRFFDLDACKAACNAINNKTPKEKLESLIGLKSAKGVILGIRPFNITDSDKEKIASRIDRNDISGCSIKKPNINFAMMGGPGTGKTTISLLIGEILCENGLLSVGHLVKKTPGELMGDHVGASEANIRKAVQDAMGGVLFIDEAYGLLEDEAKPIVTELTAAMTAYPGEFAVVIAGYDDQINELLSSDDKGNIGLSGRFANKIRLENYSAEELFEIFRLQATELNYKIADSFNDRLLMLITNLYNDRGRKKSWNNAREMENLLHFMIRADKEQKGIIDETLIPDDYMDFATDSAEKHALETIDNMVGLDNIKKELTDLKNMFLLNGDSDGVLAFVFAGPPGTGKTATAKEIGKILKRYGRLKNGDVIVRRPSDLIGRYVGQTGYLCEEVFRNSLDDVLFIDEAHRLTPDPYAPNDFGGAAIECIMKYTDRGNKYPICVILAGYEEEIEKLLDSDDGLRRRFKKVFKFEPYTEKQLLEILKMKLKAKNFEYDEAYINAALENFRSNYEKIAKYHNADYVNSYFEESEKLFAKYIIDTFISEKGITRNDLEENEELIKELVDMKNNARRIFTAECIPIINL